MKRKDKFKKDLFSLAVLTTITVFTWIVVDIYRVFNKPASTNVPKNVMQKLDPNINTQSLDQLKNRIYISQDELDSTPEILDLQLIKPVINLSEFTASPSGTVDLSDNFE